jgi:CheY-like chemotaxis protein
MPDGGTVTVETDAYAVGERRAARVGDLAPGDHARVVVRDNGHGIDPEVEAHLFEPFFTTRRHEGGAGLGLATVHGIVKQCGGAIDVRSAPDHGTAVIVYLPLVAAAEPPSAAPAPGAAGVRGNGELVLVVEDEVALRRLLELVLREAGYRVLAADDARSALALAEGCAEQIDLLVTDLVLPGMDGAEVADVLLRARPGLRVVFMTGFVRDHVGRTVAVDPAAPLLMKPFSPEALLRTVRETLAAVLHDAGRRDP